MAVTKILARHARLDLAINYAVNPDKTDEEVLTAYLNCDKGHAWPPDACNQGSEE